MLRGFQYVHGLADSGAPASPLKYSRYACARRVRHLFPVERVKVMQMLYQHVTDLVIRAQER